VLDLRRQTKRFRECKPLHTLLNISAFVSNQAFLTKSGDLGLVINYRGPDAECLEPKTLDAFTAQIAAAIKAFDENFTVSTYLRKTSNPVLNAPCYKNKVVDEAVKNRLAFLTQKGATLFSYETDLVVLFKAKRISPRMAERLAQWAMHPRKALRQSLRIEDRAIALDETLASSLKALHYAVNSFLERSAGVISTRILDKKEVFARVRRHINPNRAKADAVTLTQDLHVDYWAVDSELECHRDHLRLDEYFVKSLTLKRPPSHTFAHILRDLHRVQAEMLVVTEWSVCESGQAASDIRAKRRHWHNTKVSIASRVGSERPDERHIIFDESKEALVADLGNLLKDTVMNGVQVGRFSLTVILYGRTLASVEHATAEVMKTFGVHEGSLNEERYNGLNAFMATLPGGYPFNLRQLLITNQNHADLCPWFLPAEGERKNEFLQREYLIALETEEQSLFFLNPHVGDVGHTGIFGPTGTGKSFLQNLLITHVQAYDPFTFIFGFGGDYRWLTELFEGVHLRCSPERQAFRLNPLVLAPTPKNLEFLFSFFKLLIELGDFRMTDAQERDLFESIRSLYVLDPEQRRLLTLSTTVSRQLGERLRRWTEGEQYGAWFDNVEDTVTFQRFQYVDFEGMERLGGVLEAVLFYLLHRANDIIYDEALQTTLKVLFIDEAWRFVRHPVTLAYITEALKTWRKKNGVVTLATQSVQDFAAADVLRPVVEGCPTKLVLANPNLDADVYRDVLGLTATEIEHVRRLLPKKQFLLKRDNLSKILNLNVDPKSYWLFTTNPYEAERRRDSIDRIGLKAALDLLAGEPSK
jgi:type IV secretion/conjugal transfer VirB4 family ATPase